MGGSTGIYNRQAAVAYAEQWWNDYNPAYRQFENDCTNYISQVLRAGGIPLKRTGRQDKGWWYQGYGGNSDTWSFSWTVAHSLMNYLAQNGAGRLAVPVNSARELELGDVICYDFDGDGRWQHNTVVTAFDEQGEPLVNAHSVNSQHRDWRYETSPAYTPQIQYRFFHIIG